METISTSSVSLIDLINLTQDIAALNAVYLGISVGAILIFAGVLLGAFSFFNLKPLQEKITKQEDKIDTQKKKIDQVLESSKTETEASLEVFKENYKKDVNELIIKNNEKNILETKSQITTAEKLFIEKIESISENKNIKLKEVILSETTNKISDTEKSLQKEVSSLKTSGDLMEQNIKNIERKIKELELEEFARKNQMGAIYRAIELLREDIDEKDQYNIPNSLEKLRGQIKGYRLSVSDITLIEAQLVRLDSEPKYKTQIKDVRADILQEGKEAE